MENKSSLALKPLAGFVVDDAVAAGLAVTVGIEAALVQPPKSSSSVIFGVARRPFPLAPLGPEAGLDDDEAPPHDEKSIVVAMDGAFPAGLVVDVVLAAGSGVAQASLEPQGSALERLTNAFAWVALEAAGFGGP